MQPFTIVLQFFVEGINQAFFAFIIFDLGVKILAQLLHFREEPWNIMRKLLKGLLSRGLFCCFLHTLLRERCFRSSRILALIVVLSVDYLLLFHAHLILCFIVIGIGCASFFCSWRTGFATFAH